MPKSPINYSNTIIYRIVCKDMNITDCYVGQTSNFTRRKTKHKYSCNIENSKGYNYYVYEFIRDNGGFENWDMIEIEKYNAVDSNDAKKRERYWIEFYKADLNKKIPSRTKEEYYEENKDYFTKKKKEYYEENKEIIAEKTKQYCAENKEIILERKKIYHKENKEKIAERKKIYNKENKAKIAERIKIYRKENKEKIAEKIKIYRKENKEEINLKQKETVICECGCISMRCNLKRHQTSKKHLNAINNICVLIT